MRASANGNRRRRRETGTSVNISKINDIPILGHQGPGSITDITIRRLLTLQGAMAPDEIISLMSYKDQPTTLALPDHANRIQITYTPDFGTNKKLSGRSSRSCKPGQWIQLINRISQIPEPVVPIAPSKYAIRTAHRRLSRRAHSCSASRRSSCHGRSVRPTAATCSGTPGDPPGAAPTHVLVIATLGAPERRRLAAGARSSVKLSLSLSPPR